MPLKNSNVAPATLRLSQILENITQQGGTSVVVSGAQSAMTREIAIAKVITTANITLSGEQTIDGISVVQGDTVLVNNQTSEVNNGLYGCRTGAWVRITDPPVISGLPVIVNQGTTADSLWIQMRDFTSYIDGTTNLKWVQVGTGVTYTVSDTNTVDMVMTGTVISANVRYQDSNSIDFSDDAGGLRADVKLATPSVGGNISIESTGLRFNHKLTTGRGINLLNNLPATGDLQIVNNIASGVGVRILEDTPSAGVLTVNHDINGTEGITVTDNSPSSGDLNIKVVDGGISTAKLADDSVTTDKIEDGAVTIEKVDPEVYTEYYKRFNITSGGIIPQLTHTVRIPDTGFYFPIGIYEVHVFVEIATQNMFFQTNNNTLPQSLVLIWSNSGSGVSTTIDKTPTHEDLVSGSHKLINSSMQGSAIININESTQSLRYFEVYLDLTANAASFRSSFSGYVHVKQLKAGTELTLET